MRKIRLTQDIVDPDKIVLAEAGMEFSVRHFLNPLVVECGGGTMLVPLEKCLLLVGNNPPAQIVDAGEGTFWIDEQVSDRIMQQYEHVRKTGRTNMLDFASVLNIAILEGCSDLAEISHEEYRYLIINYTRLATMYGIIDG